MESQKGLNKKRNRSSENGSVSKSKRNNKKKKDKPLEANEPKKLNKAKDNAIERTIEVEEGTPYAVMTLQKIDSLIKTFDTLLKFKSLQHIGMLQFGPKGVSLSHCPQRGWVNMVLHKVFFQTNGYECKGYVDLYCDLRRIHYVLKSLKQNNCVSSGGKILVEVTPKVMKLTGMNRNLLERTSHYVYREQMKDKDMGKQSPPQDSAYYQAISLTIPRLRVIMSDIRNRDCKRVKLRYTASNKTFDVIGLSNEGNEVLCEQSCKGVTVKTRNSGISDQSEDSVFESQKPQDYEGTFLVDDIWPMCQSKIKNTVRLLTGKGQDLVMDIYIDIYTNRADPDHVKKSSYLRTWVVETE